MKFSSLQNYKHDVVGKLSFIQKIVSPISETDFYNRSKDEVFLAVHESILKILKTSKETIIQRNSPQIKLIISGGAPDPSLSVFKLGKCTVRADASGIISDYFYFTQENTLNLVFAVGRIESLLPITEITSEFLDEDITAELKKLDSK
jgi:hypothetical protein